MVPLGANEKATTAGHASRVDQSRRHRDHADRPPVSYLLDTNVVSELSKPRPDPAVRRWFATVRSTDLYLSVLVVGEISQGVARLRGRDASRASSIAAWRDELVSRFRDRIAPVSLEVAHTWGTINAGDPLPVVDSLLAATALTHDWTLVSRNEKDLGRTGVKLLNPFEVVH
jgi:predicted nucleic acid-binding protein